MQEEARLLRHGLQYVETMLKEDMETVASFREVRPAKCFAK